MLQNRNLMAFLAFAWSCSVASAASLGQRYDSYRDLHEKTQYGSLFFNEGSIRYQQSRNQKRFVAIDGTGGLDLPAQQGYCFVFNHYDSPNGNDSMVRIYKAKITKTFSDGDAVELIERTYTPTSDVVSSNLPDLCVSGLRNVSKISIQFTSNDGRSFDWQISFVPK